MRLRALAAAGLAAVALSAAHAVADTGPVPGAAPAIDSQPTAEPPRDPGPLSERALALVTAAPPPGYELHFEAHASGRPRAQLDRRARVITVFVRAHDAPHRVAHDIAHELGHAWDDRHQTDAMRRRYLRRRGAPQAPWWPGGAWSDYDTGAGDFAEMFARCHAASPEFRSRVAPAPPDACVLLPPAARSAA